MAGATAATVVLDGAVPERPSRARRWVTEQCRALGLDLDGIDLTLLVSELVTNASTHGDDPVCLRLVHRAGRLRVEVEDGSSRLPHVRHPARDTPGGRGLLIVETVSDTWGADLAAAGKVVWAEVVVGRGAAVSAHQGRS